MLYGSIDIVYKFDTMWVEGHIPLPKDSDNTESLLYADTILPTNFKKEVPWVRFQTHNDLKNLRDSVEFSPEKIKQRLFDQVIQLYLSKMSEKGEVDLSSQQLRKDIINLIENDTTWVLLVEDKKILINSFLHPKKEGEKFIQLAIASLLAPTKNQDIQKTREVDFDFMLQGLKGCIKTIIRIAKQGDNNTMKEYIAKMRMFPSIKNVFENFPDIERVILDILPKVAVHIDEIQEKMLLDSIHELWSTLKGMYVQDEFSPKKNLKIFNKTISTIIWLIPKDDEHLSPLLESFWTLEIAEEHPIISPILKILQSPSIQKKHRSEIFSELISILSVWTAPNDTPSNITLRIQKIISLIHNISEDITDPQERKTCIKNLIQLIQNLSGKNIQGKTIGAVLWLPEGSISVESITRSITEKIVATSNFTSSIYNYVTETSVKNIKEDAIKTGTDISNKLIKAIQWLSETQISVQDIKNTLKDTGNSIKSIRDKLSLIIKNRDVIIAMILNRDQKIEDFSNGLLFDTKILKDFIQRAWGNIWEGLKNAFGIRLDKKISEYRELISKSKIQIHLPNVSKSTASSSVLETKNKLLKELFSLVHERLQNGEKISIEEVTIEIQDFLKKDKDILLETIKQYNKNIQWRIPNTLLNEMTDNLINSDLIYLIIKDFSRTWAWENNISNTLEKVLISSVQKTLQSSESINTIIESFAKALYAESNKKNLWNSVNNVLEKYGIELRNMKILGSSFGEALEIIIQHNTPESITQVLQGNKDLLMRLIYQELSETETNYILTKIGIQLLEWVEIKTPPKWNTDIQKLHLLHKLSVEIERLKAYIPVTRVHNLYQWNAPHGNYKKDFEAIFKILYNFRLHNEWKLSEVMQLVSIENNSENDKNWFVDTFIQTNFFPAITASIKSFFLKWKINKPEVLEEYFSDRNNMDNFVAAMELYFSRK